MSFEERMRNINKNITSMIERKNSMFLKIPHADTSNEIYIYGDP